MSRDGRDLGTYVPSNTKGIWLQPGDYLIHFSCPDWTGRTAALESNLFSSDESGAWKSTDGLHAVTDNTSRLITGGRLVRLSGTDDTIAMNITFVGDADFLNDSTKFPIKSGHVTFLDVGGAASLGPGVYRYHIFTSDWGAGGGVTATLQTRAIGNENLEWASLVSATDTAIGTVEGGRRVQFTATDSAARIALLQIDDDTTPSGALSIGASQGSVYFHDGTGLTALPPGTAGQVLISGGPGANPSWGAAVAPEPWILSGGAWNDSAAWDDTQAWSDAA